jgi:WD40 repeat protein
MDFRFDRSRLGAMGNAGADRSAEQQSSTTGRLRHAPSDAPKGFFALVEKNQLFFRIVGETPEAPADLSRAFIRNVISDFRKVFTGVWNRIPPGDRQILLDYWRGRDMLAVGRGPWYRPLIQVFEILPFPVGAKGVAFSPDGKLLAMAAYAQPKGQHTGAVMLWDLVAGKERTDFQGKNVAALTVAFSPDGKLLASGTPSLQGIRIWSVATGKQVQLVEDSAAIRHMVFSPDGKYLATGHGKFNPRGAFSVQLWDTTTWKEAAVLEGHNDFLLSVSFTRDGRYLASASQDGTVKVWPVPPAAAVARRRSSGPN